MTVETMTQMPSADRQVQGADLNESKEMNPLHFAWRRMMLWLMKYVFCTRRLEAMLHHKMAMQIDH